MAAPKGTRPPAAGKGRKKGVPNRTSGALREVVTLFVEHNADGAQALYDRVAAKNPAKALELLARFCEFVLPKQREITGTLASFHINADAPITDAATAAQAYAAIIADPSFDFSRISFAQHEPSPVTSQEPIEAPMPRALTLSTDPAHIVSTMRTDATTQEAGVWTTETERRPMPPTFAAALPAIERDEPAVTDHVVSIWEKLGK
jgi:hypothetical protein